MSKRIQSITLAVLCFLLVFGAYSLSFFDGFEEKIFDRFFIRESPPKHIVIVAIDDTSLTAFGQWPWPREIFASALARLQTAKIIGFDINFAEPSRLGSLDDELFVQAIKVSKPLVVMPVETDIRNKISVQPIQSIREYVKVGVVNVEPDRDGTTRFIQKNTTTLFSEVLAGVGAGDTPVRINYRGPEKTFLTIPFESLISGEIPARVFDDVTVLIGATSPDLHDFVLTPFGSMVGVELHANNIATLQDSKHFKDISSPVSALFFLCTSFLVVVSIEKIKRLVALLTVFAVIFIGIFFAGALLFSFKIVLPILYIELSFVLAAFVLIVFHYIFESKEKRFIRKVFQYYLMPDVIEDLLQDPSKASLGGEEREMTIMFSDIRGFTTISEKLSPTDLTTLLNEYLTAMTDIVMEEGGVVDKYIGDAVMAFWGAPIPNPLQADRACNAAIRMKNKLFELNQVWVKKGWPELHIGIGLNKGKVVVGNMGSSKRFNYTVMGDEVNFASRLEGITKQYSVACLVSESVARSVISKNIVFRDLDLVLVKGKKEPRRIFDIVPDGSFLADWERGRELYTKGMWKEARDVFEKINKKEPHDIPTSLYIERCEQYLQNPPTDWKGVHEFKDK